MGAASKKARRVRQVSEFDLARLSGELRQPRDGRTTIDAWSLEDIFQARQEQMIGQFVRAARMAEQMRTDDALAVAYENRLAPQRCIPVEIKAAPGARGAAIAKEANASFGPNGYSIHPDTLADVHGCLVNHGVAFATVAATPREDGSRVDFKMNYFPIEYVRWDPVFRVFKARVEPSSVQPGDVPDPSTTEYGFVGGYWLPVIHGDGRWIIFKKHEIDPFRQEAAILPSAIVWARHAFACRDWSKGSVAHGNAKVIGELPTGVALQVNGDLTPEAAAFLELLRAIGSADTPIGVRPAGSKTDFLTNNSTAWQVWEQLVANAEKAAARIYLGTDGTLGTQGGAPGVDITALLGVAATKVRGDLECIERGIDTGIIEPWTAVNFGDSSLSPKRKYLIPNDENQAVLDALAKRTASYWSALAVARTAGVTLTNTYCEQLAVDYNVRVPTFSAAMAPPQPAGAPPGGSTPTGE